MKIRTPLAAIALSAIAFGAFAQASGPAATPRVDARQAKQEQRVDQGIATGQLNKRETKKLQAEQNRIDRSEDRAKADGVVTKGERTHLTHMQNKTSRDIHRQKHDRQTAASAAAAR